MGNSPKKIKGRLWVADSSIWIGYLRYGKYENFLFTHLAKQTLFCPSPVLYELYAGATTRQDRQDIETLRRGLGNNSVNSTMDDWVLAGRCVSAYTLRFGKAKPGDHVGDLLIALVAVRLGASLRTENLKDMKRWRDVLKRLGKHLDVQPASS